MALGEVQFHQNQKWAWQIFENVNQTTFQKLYNRFRLLPRNCSWKVVFDFQNLGNKVVKMVDVVLVRSRIVPLTGLCGFVALSCREAREITVKELGAW
jgi:hypothetical protein